MPFLGELPLEPEVRVGGDTGRPIVLRGPEDAAAAAFLAMARRVYEATQVAAQKKGPSITISD